MSTELVKAEHTESQALTFSSEQRQLIRDAYANGASEQEFRVLLAIAQKRQLDPLMKQIHFVKRWDTEKQREVWSAQVSIDGLRAIAERSGKYDGQDEPEFEYDGTNIILARVRVYRKDWARPSVGVAHMDEYMQTKKDGTPTQFWAKKPHIMLAKCAESLAIRKAFPEDTSGLYTPEEMGASTIASHDAPVADYEESEEHVSFESLLARARSISTEEELNKLLPILSEAKTRMAAAQISQLAEVVKSKSNTLKSTAS